MKYGDNEPARIPATIGDNSKRWYLYTEFLQHDRVEEELRRWGPTFLPTEDLGLTSWTDHVRGNVEHARIPDAGCDVASPRLSE